MTLHILSPDKNGQIDPTIKRNLLDYLPNQVGRGEAEVVVVPISYFSDYVFYCSLYDETRQYILVDFMEYGGSWDRQSTHLFGQAPLPSNIQGQEWVKLDEWVKFNPPLLYFKRELLKRDISPKVLPIEFACYIDAQPLQTREQWLARPLEALNIWGYSHPSRPKLHAKIFEAMNNGIGVISAWDQFFPYFDSVPKGQRTWATIHSPHFTRQHINKIMEWQRSAKITVSLPGNGQICFRSTEAPVDSIMAHHKNELAHAFPWEPNVNCIELGEGSEFESLEAATNRDDLYDIYCKSVENIDRYRSARFALEYVYPKIEEAYGTKH